MSSASRFELLKFYIRPYRKQLAVLTLLYLFYVVSETFSIAAIYPLITALTGVEPSSTSRATRFLNSLSGILPIQNKLISVATFVIIVQVVKTVLAVAFEESNAKITSELHYDLKRRIFEKLCRSKYEYFLDKKAGELIYAANTASFKPAISVSYFLQAAVEAFKFITVLAFLFSLSAAVTGGMVVAGLFFIYLNEQVSKKISYVTGSKRTVSSNRSLTLFQEFLAGIKQISIFNVRRFWQQEFNKANREYSDLYLKDARWLAISGRLFELASMAGSCAILIVIALWNQTLLKQNLALISVYLFAIIRIMPSVKTFGSLRMQIAGNVADAEMVRNVLIQPAEIASSENQRALGSFEKEIEFRNVTFAYGDRTPVLDHMNLKIPKGKVIAFVGSSGAGKTTLLNLLLGLYQPTGGELLVDSQNLQNIETASWLKHIGFVSQDNFIFHASIFENIAFGRPAVTREQVEHAAKLANAHEFISRMPEGYSTIVGERGMKLSGGQQQRLAIARALVSNPSILIFDEATSALDSANEKIIQETIDRISQHHTVIIVAHRLSTVKNANTIYVLQNGKVVEKGNFQELVSKNGEFARLANLTTQG